MPDTDLRFTTRALESAGARIGIDEVLIHRVVHEFYAKIRQDVVLQDMFNRIIAERWSAHLEKMCDFWSSVMLSTGRFKGAPMVAHVKIHELRSPHFDHWQHLFAQTVNEICPGKRAELFISKAKMIGQSLQLGIAMTRGELPAQTLGQGT